MSSSYIFCKFYVSLQFEDFQHLMFMHFLNRDEIVFSLRTWLEKNIAISVSVSLQDGP